MIRTIRGIGKYGTAAIDASSTKSLFVSAVARIGIRKKKKKRNKRKKRKEKEKKKLVGSLFIIEGFLCSIAE